MVHLAVYPDPECPAHIIEFLRFARIDNQVIGPTVLSDDLTGIHLVSGLDRERLALKRFQCVATDLAISRAIIAPFRRR